MPSLPPAPNPASPLDAKPAGPSSFPVKITYYLEVISSWCHWAEPTWAELKARYAGRAQFDWKVALMRPEDFPVSPAQTEWFYRRSGTIVQSPYMLNAGWFEPKGGALANPNLVAEAAKDLGVTGDEVRLALSHAALREGRRVGEMAVAVAIAAKAGGLSPKKLRARAESAAVRARVDASTAEFHSHRVTQRPTFILESAIGDKAVLSGIVRAAPLFAAADALLADAAAYATHAAHFGGPPQD
jgi:predicted DsbA family dithiol-disulfide isomerase